MTKFTALASATAMTTAIGLLASAGALAAQDAGLLVFDYPGFEDPAFHSKYKETHGASPTFAFFGDEEEAFQKLRSGFRADVSHVCAGSVTKWIEADMLEAWDTARITVFDDLDANLTGQDVAAVATETFFIPTDFGSTAIAYNADQVPAADVGSLAVFQNPAYAGRMTLPDNVDDAFALAYLATGTTNWTSATDELAQLLAGGEVLVAWAWNETLPTMVEDGFPIGFNRETTEGSSLWLCGYVKLKNGQGSQDKAYDFINAMLDPSSTQPLLDAGYGHSNAASMASFGDDALSAVGLGQIDAPVLAQLPMANDLRQKQSEAFERIKAGF